MDLENIHIYGDQTFADLLKRIDKNSSQKAEKIEELVNDLADMVEDVQDATILIPLIREYLEIDVKNDDHLIKVAKIIQRMYSAEVRNTDSVPGGASGGGLTDTEKEEIQKMAKEMRDEKRQQNESPKNQEEESVEDLEKMAEEAKKELKNMKDEDV